nr:immunoglobulin heavy chain junction region [Mus musculus]
CARSHYDYLYYAMDFW